ncbi:hypothetical protein DAI22_10g158300 [Oryza sativa Japonica Group]|uniref:Expressed protein n=1 Tax=Oryza sativa subsp. japonica TaxID=39947 RepID=Q337B9_ORYSJ|nr:expressed protein [Oryza sativa Japonica Group]KAF2914385.1 hypothetical protein DAI22_10g158300 [Oryza sativa Japonica Group]BAH00314.1 unnamed protein product [Oryza sativa Japonica Group]
MPWIWRPLQATVSSVAPWSSPTSAPAVVDLAALLNPGAQGEGVLITVASTRQFSAGPCSSAAGLHHTNLLTGCSSPLSLGVSLCYDPVRGSHVRRERLDGWCEDIQPIALVDLVVTCVRFKGL